VLYLWDDVLLLLTGAPRSPQHSGEHSGGGRFPSKRVRAPALGDVLLVLIQILAFSNSYILIYTSRCTGWPQDDDPAVGSSGARSGWADRRLYGRHDAINLD
jgi:hypothetical protein